MQLRGKPKILASVAILALSAQGARGVNGASDEGHGTGRQVTLTGGAEGMIMSSVLNSSLT